MRTPVWAPIEGRPYTHLRLLSPIIVRAFNPITSDRRTDVHLIGVFNGLRAVVHECRNQQSLATSHHDLISVDQELERASKYRRQLLALVIVRWNKAAFLKKYPRHRHLLA